MTLPFGQGIHAGLGIFKNLTAFKNSEIPSNPENRIYPELVSKEQLGTYIVTDWQSVNTPDEYSRIKKKFASQVEHYPNS